MPDSAERARMLLEKARKDLAAAELVLNVLHDGDLALCLVEQASEKALKARLIVLAAPMQALFGELAEASKKVNKSGCERAAKKFRSLGNKAKLLGNPRHLGHYFNKGLRDMEEIYGTLCYGGFLLCAQDALREYVKSHHRKASRPPCKPRGSAPGSSTGLPQASPITAA